jgi:ferredoxin
MHAHRSLPAHHTHLAGVGTDDVPELPFWCAEAGCDTCRSHLDEPVLGRQAAPSASARARSPTARLPEGARPRYP